MLTTIHATRTVPATKPTSLRVAPTVIDAGGSGLGVSFQEISVSSPRYAFPGHMAATTTNAIWRPGSPPPDRRTS